MKAKQTLRLNNQALKKLELLHSVLGEKTVNKTINKIIENFKI